MVPATTSPLLTAAAVPVRRSRPARRRFWNGPLLRDAALNDRFINEDRVLTLRNVRILCWIAIVLVVAAVVLDWFAYPNLVSTFLGYRLMCALCLTPVLFVITTELGRRYYRAFTIIVPMLPALCISLMIHVAHDPGSGYYAGLTLCLVAIGFMFHWTFVESIIALCLTLVFYFVANAWIIWEGMPLTMLGAFVNNTVFILLNGVVIVCGSFYHHRIRVREFLNRVEIEQQREELTARNDTLTTTLRQLRDTESQLVHSEKLASLGRMSAGIIHEINNPLNFTNQALFVLKKKGKHLPDAEREHFDRIVTDIKDGIGRVSSIVSDLRSFAHSEGGAHAAVDLVDVLQHAARLMSQPVKDARAHVAIDTPEDTWIIGDRNHLIQILINLLQNAIDAVRNTEEPAINIDVVEQAQHTEVRIRDNGCGIPPQNLSRIFDPFFTTKAVGEGMGMGLSICYRLMHQMRGGIDVASEPGLGTTFTLRFPRPKPEPTSHD